MKWSSEDEEKSVSAKSIETGQLLKELVIILDKRAKTIGKEKAIKTGKI